MLEQVPLTQTGETKKHIILRVIYRILSNKAFTADLNSDADWALDAFLTGHSLFYSAPLGQITTFRDNMENDFGIVPSPKLLRIAVQNPIYIVTKLHGN